MKIKSFFSQYLPVIISAVILTVCLAYAWTPPSSNPPSGNVPAPINTGPSTQTKSGTLQFKPIAGGDTLTIGGSGRDISSTGFLALNPSNNHDVYVGGFGGTSDLYVSGDTEIKGYGFFGAINNVARLSTKADQGFALFADSDNNASDNNVAFKILTNSNYFGGAVKNLFEIKQNGNVGIGIHPSYKLHVSDRAKFDGSTAGMWIEAGGNDWFIGRSGTGGSNLRIWNNNKNRITLEPDGDIIFEIGN